MTFMDRVRSLFRPASPVSAPKPRLEGSADWTRREIEAAQRVSGRAPLSAEAQTTVDREIASIKKASLQPQDEQSHLMAIQDEVEAPQAQARRKASLAQIDRCRVLPVPASQIKDGQGMEDVRIARTLGEASQGLAADRRVVNPAPQADAIKRGRSHTLG